MEAQSGFQRVNGLRLFVHRFRDASVLPSGLTLLLLHGYQDAGATWDLVAEHLVRAGHDVIAPDLRGFGQSDAVGSGGYYHFPDYVADVAELVDAIAPRRLGVVGHSMGGTIAALYAGALPQRVERLALLEGLGPLATEPSFAVDRMRAWLSDLRREKPGPRTLSSMTEAIERLVYKHPAVPRDVLAARAKLLTRADHAGQLTHGRTTACTARRRPRRSTSSRSRRVPAARDDAGARRRRRQDLAGTRSTRPIAWRACRTRAPSRSRTPGT